MRPSPFTVYMNTQTISLKCGCSKSKRAMLSLPVAEWNNIANTERLLDGDETVKFKLNV